MKINEAIMLMKKTCVERNLHWGYGGEECKLYGCYEALEMAIEALEKQIPKKVTIYEVNSMCGGKWYKCPSCEMEFDCYEVNNEVEYCSCGQHIDWGDVK